MKTSNNILYIGSTPDAFVFHIGMTSNNRNPEDRWRDSAYRGKLSYIPKKVAYYLIGLLRDEPIHRYILKNKNITSVKKEDGISSPEIFRVNATILDPKKYIQSVVEEAITFEKTGVRPVEKFFVARPHQAWVNQQILIKFDGTKTIIQPINACPRFGKTLGGLSLFKESGLRIMILASYVLSANESFIADVESKFDITSDITIIKPDYQLFKKAYEKGQRILIDVSLHPDAEKIDQDLLSALAEMSSLIYIDEADYGAWTKSSRATANPFIGAGINLVCIATGTNIDRALIGYKGKVEYPINVSYLDLIEAKRGNGHLFEFNGFCEKDPQKWITRSDDVVEIDCLNLDAEKDLIDELNSLTDEQRPNMTKIFAKRNTHIQNKIIRSLLFDEEYGTDVFGLYASEYGSIEHPAIMMFIPGGKSDVDNLVKVGKSIAPHYNWVALHGGNNYTNRIAENKVKDIICNGGGEKTIIISCGMGSRSFSIPNIIATILCKDGGSVGTDVQQGLRCATPGCDKKVGWVVNYSFNSERTSGFETAIISSALQSNPGDVDSALRRVYGIPNFLRKDENGYLIKLTPSDFMRYVTSRDNLENMASASIDMDGLLNNLDILEHLKNVQTHSSTNEEWNRVIEKAKTYIEKRHKTNAPIDDEKRTIRDLVRKVHRIIHTTGNAYYLAPYASNFEECLNVIANDPIKDREYVDLVGVSAQVILNSIYDILPKTFMNLIINRVREFDTNESFEHQTAAHPDSVFDIDSL